MASKTILATVLLLTLPTVAPAQRQMERLGRGTVAVPASLRMPTLTHDPQYRLAIAWQNVGNTQPPHPGFFLGVGGPLPRRPPIVVNPFRMIGD